MYDGCLREQIVLEFPIEDRVLAADPLKDHCRMFFFLVPVMGEDCLQFGILAGIDSLILPIDRL